MPVAESFKNPERESQVFQGVRCCDLSELISSSGGIRAASPGIVDFIQRRGCGYANADAFGHGYFGPGRGVPGTITRGSIQKQGRTCQESRPIARKSRECSYFSELHAKPPCEPAGFFEGKSGEQDSMLLSSTPGEVEDEPATNDARF